MAQFSLGFSLTIASRLQVLMTVIENPLQTPGLRLQGHCHLQPLCRPTILDLRSRDRHSQSQRIFRYTGLRDLCEQSRIGGNRRTSELGYNNYECRRGTCLKASPMKILIRIQLWDVCDYPVRWCRLQDIDVSGGFRMSRHCEDVRGYPQRCFSPCEVCLDAAGAFELTSSDPVTWQSCCTCRSSRCQTLPKVCSQYRFSIIGIVQLRF